MRQYHRSRRGLRRTETRSRSPCARSICRLSRRSKTDTPTLAEPQAKLTLTPSNEIPRISREALWDCEASSHRFSRAIPKATRGRLRIPKAVAKTRKSFSCDDAKPFHFPVEPDAVNHQRSRSGKRRDGAREINRRAFHEIDPDTPRSDAEREQRRENNENNMEAFKRHLTEYRVVVPGQKYKPEKSQHKKAGKNQDAVNEPLFRGKMHENGCDGARFQRRHQHSNADVGFARSEIDIGKSDRDGGECEQERADDQITSNVLLYAVRVFLVFLGVLRNIRRIVHVLEQIEQREHKYPDQIYKVPEQATYLDAISQMLRVALVKFFADRQPHVYEHEHAAEHVHSVQTSDREIAGEIRAVRRQKHRRALDVFLLERRDFISERQRKKVRQIHGRIGGLGVERVERDFVFLDLGIVQRRAIVQMASDLEPRRQTFGGGIFVSQILFVLPEGFRLNVSAEVIKLLWPFVSQLDDKENHATRNRRQHVPPIGTIPSNLQRRPCQNHRD